MASGGRESWNFLSRTPEDLTKDVIDPDNVLNTIIRICRQDVEANVEYANLMTKKDRKGMTQTEEHEVESKSHTMEVRKTFIPDTNLPREKGNGKSRANGLSRRRQHGKQQWNRKTMKVRNRQEDMS